MKNFITTLFALLFTVSLFAQGSIKGTVVDQNQGDESLIGATVYLKGTNYGTATDYNGLFTIDGVDAGDYVLVISYTGYSEKSMDVTVRDGENDLGKIEMTSSSIGLQEVNVIASVAVDRKTPVAVTTLKGDVIEAKVGNQEFPEILRNTPSIYVTKQGGGFGDARINVRGFDQRNTAVMINGIPVNDMENGWVYWSNWAGLSDVTSTLQVQRGLGATKLAVPAVGGSINIITNAADMDKGGAVSMSLGNDGYQKYGVVLSSGQLANGWAFTGQATHTRGDGYVDGTAFRAYSYFLSANKTFNDQHSISITALGAPQWHHQRNAAGRFDNITLRTFVDPDNLEDDVDNGIKYDQGIRFNHTWGMLDGKEFNFRRNFYHKPKAFVNHYWTISDKTSLKSSAYVSFGRGGGTGPRGRLRTPGSVFDSFGGFGKGIHDENGQIRFDDIVTYNQGGTVDGWGDPKETFDGQFIVSNNGQIDTTNAGSGFVRRASMNSHNWYGILSTLTHDINENWSMIAGIDGRYYLGQHYRRLENLLGADAYLSRSDVNGDRLITEVSEAQFGNFADNSFQDETNANVLAYHNDGKVTWAGLFGQVEYSNDVVSWFASASVSSQSFKRVDFFNYKDGDVTQTTPWITNFGAILKTGLNYNINAQNNVFLNVGYADRQPIFDNLFVGFQNEIAFGVENQKIKSAEAGYGFRSKMFDAKLNLYYTNWGNRQISRNLDVLIDSVEVNGQAIFSDIDQIHSGVELEFNFKPHRMVSINGMVSLGNWEYGSTFIADIYDEDQNIIGQDSIYADGLKVGDAAQTTFNIGVNFKPVKGLNIYADYYVADNLYADFDIDDSQFTSPGGQVAKLPSYGLMNAGLSYRLPVGPGELTLRVNVNNVLDETYIAELETNIVDNPDTPDVNELYDNRGFFGFGRTWNAGLKYNF